MGAFLKSFFLQNRLNLTIILFGVVGAPIALLVNWQIGIDTTKQFTHSLLDMISFLPAIFLLIGWMDAWIPKSVVERHTGRDSGLRSMLWMLFLAMLQAGPLYAAFPVAYLLWKKGTSTRNIFIYLGAFSSLKLPTLGFEVSFMGWKFTLIRTLLTLPVFAIIAWLMDILFDRSFSMKDPSSEEHPPVSVPSPMLEPPSSNDLHSDR
jgi:uncharacterized membrane protein YraQ (UPF0718 family)